MKYILSLILTAVLLVAVYEFIVQPVAEKKIDADHPNLKDFHKIDDIRQRLDEMN